MLIAERCVLYTLGFELHLTHPYSYLVNVSVRRGVEA